MPEARLLATTSPSGLLSLGWSEQLVFTMHHQVLRVLQEFQYGTLASFLARPIYEQKRGEIDWYTGLEGPMVRYVDATPEERQAADTRIHHMVTGIDSYAADVRQRDTREGVQLVRILEAALFIPNKDHIYLVDGTPVVTCWGFQVDRDRLTYFDLRQIRPAMLSNRRGWRWRLWLGLLALLLALLALLYSGTIPPIPFMGGVTPTISVSLPTLEPDEPPESMPPSSPIIPPAPAVAEVPPPPSAPAPTSPAPTTTKQDERPPPAPAPTSPAGQAASTEIETRRKREKARSGKVTVTLIWDNINDLDLHIECPNGQTISYKTKEACRGKLDIDQNRLVDFRSFWSLVSNPVENVYLEENALQGEYTVIVHFFGENKPSSSPTTFKVKVARAGGEIKIYEGQVAPGEKKKVATFSFTRNSQ